MNKKKDATYRMPEGFNPYTSMDAIRGLANSIHHTLLEGAGTAREMPYPDKASLNGLVELLRKEVHALHAYFTALEDRGLLDLPLGQDEIEALDPRNGDNVVREEPALYLVSRQ